MLNYLGPDAAAAGPELLRLYRQEQGLIRELAGKALVRVDPEAAARAGIPER
jgi:hypothetical protein